MQNRLFCVSLLLGGFALTSHAQLALQPPPSIALRAGGGGVTFALTEDAKGAPKTALTLTAGPIVDSVTHSVITGAAATLSPVVDSAAHADSVTHAAVSAPAPAAPSVGGAKLPTNIGPGDTLLLTATVKGVSGSSEVEFPIFNGAMRLATLTAFSADAALNISVDGDGSAPDKSLAYTYGKTVVIALKNGDAQSYKLHWDFQIDNQSESHGDFDMPLNGNSRIPITPSGKPFKLVDWVHPSSKKGMLLLSFMGPANFTPDLLPTRPVQVSLVMQRHEAFVSSALSYSYVGLLLLIGGILSFLGNSTLPNVQKKGELRAQLRELANRTSTVSTLIDSYLRVLLRLERSRIANLISNEPAWIPASAEPLISAAASIDNLAKRLAAAERLDDLRRKHDQISGTAPPSVTDGIDANLQAAADQLHSVILSDNVMAAANGFFAKAQAALAMLDDTEALAKQIAGNVALVMTRLAKFPPNYYADLKASLPGVFLFADPNRNYDKAENIVRPMLFAIDHGAAAMQLALDYAIVRASIPIMPDTLAQPPVPAVLVQPVAAPPSLNPDAAMAPPANAALVAGANAVPAVPADAPPIISADSALKCEPHWDLARQRLLDRHCRLIELLGTLSWRALREAALLVQEMREDTYEEDVLDEICTQGQAEIVFDAQKIRPFQPVFFSIKFKNSRFNDSAALQRLLCQWTFPGDLNEYTWKVCHYFQSDEQRTSTTGDLNLCATIRGQRSDESRKVPVPPLKTTVSIDRLPARDWSRLAAEGFRFAIAFAVALAALLSGALEQLGKLDVIPASITIIGLGFSASAVKNLLTQSATPQTPPPAPPVSKP